MSQLDLSFRQHGGRRPGAGRKPGPGRRNVRHRRRERLASRFPVLITLRASCGLGSLRSKHTFRRVRRALADGSGRFGFRVTHYSVQRDHMHLVVEAKDRLALSRGMQGLAIRLAKGVNGALGRPRGRVFTDRYHDRILRTPREVRHALAYTLTNARKHGVAPPHASRDWVDPCSSGPWFDGWRGRVAVPWAWVRGTGPPDPPVAPPHTWLLAKGWRRHGLLDPWRPPSPSHCH
jgi:REP element-mobilizing transposase RayT